MGVKQPYPLRTRIPSDQSWAYHVFAYKKKEDKNYGAFGPRADLAGKKATKIVFD